MHERVVDDELLSTRTAAQEGVDLGLHEGSHEPNSMENTGSMTTHGGAATREAAIDTSEHRPQPNDRANAMKNEARHDAIMQTVKMQTERENRDVQYTTLQDFQRHHFLQRAKKQAKVMAHNYERTKLDELRKLADGLVQVGTGERQPTTKTEVTTSLRDHHGHIPQAMQHLMYYGLEEPAASWLPSSQSLPLHLSTPWRVTNPQCTDTTPLASGLLAGREGLSDAQIYFTAGEAVDSDYDEEGWTTIDVETRDERSTAAAQADNDARTKLMTHETLLAVTTFQPRYKSMCATLGVRDHEQDGDRQFHEIQAIVDSGAAFSSADHRLFSRLFPSLRVVPEQRTFNGATGAKLRLRGRATVDLSIGSRVVATTVYLFDNLAVPFLLGTNTLTEGRMLIDPADSRLVIKATADEPSTSVPMETAHNQRGTEGPNAQSLQVQTSTNPNSCEIEHSEGQLRITCCHGLQCTQICVKCDEEMTVRQMVDLPAETISCTRWGEDFDFRKAARHDTADRMRSKADTPICPIQKAALKLCHAQTVPAGFKSMPIALYYDTPIAGPNCAIKVEVGDRLRKSGLLAVPITIQQSRHQIITIHVTNATPDAIRLDRNSLLAWGSPTTDVTDEAECMIAAEEGRPAADAYSILLNDTAAEPPMPSGPISAKEVYDLGLSLDESVDCKRRDADGRCQPLSDEQKEQLLMQFRIHHRALCRDPRSPPTCWATRVTIPTGDHAPVQQRPYPMPYKYLEAARDEIAKLLDAGLIAPGYSNWSSPVICIVKKDSTPGKLRIKLAVDYRALNAVTVPDVGQLGDQSEVLSGFGNGQGYRGLCDAAAGYYQLGLSPEDAHKTCFVVPASMGGTSFIWKVAPYGLSRLPAAYSRTMMLMMRGLSSITLSDGSLGGVGTWLDDISFHAETFDGYCELVGMILARLVSAGMTLKASKCDLLHQELHVLGYLATPDGLRMDPAKVEAITRMPCPIKADEVRTFMGMCNFQRHFCEHLGTLAADLWPSSGPNCRQRCC